MSDLQVRDLAMLSENRTLRAENARLRDDVRTLRDALLEQAQLAEEAGFALRGVARTARGVANDRSLDGET